MTIPTESTLRDALQNLLDACYAADVAGNLAGEVDGSLLDAARAALSAHPARASQEQGELSDEEILAVTSKLGFAQLSPLEVARAIIAADRAARPESVDARRLDWLREHTIATGLSRWMGAYQFLDEAVDAAIAAEGAA